MNIGILALQGGFQAHRQKLDSLGVTTTEIRLPDQLASCDGLVLPGGESTTMLKLIHAYQLWEPLQAFAALKRPILGTCAGAILMARKVNFKNQESFNWLPVSIDRNAYGTQVQSFRTKVDCPLWDLKQVDAFFIRAPKFVDIEAGVAEISRSDDGINGVEFEHFSAVTYHPELGDEARFHQAWLQRFF